jgi:hypothetical protein
MYIHNRLHGREQLIFCAGHVTSYILNNYTAVPGIMDTGIRDYAVGADSVQGRYRTAGIEFMAPRG